MGFLAPYMFWGLLALSVPLLIHLWNGRKGEKVYWAAFRFLEENDNKPIRHIRLEQWMLMLLRMLLILLLVLVMVQVFLGFLEKEREVQTVHLVEPNQELLSEFKFELNQAIERGEKVILLNAILDAIERDNSNIAFENEKMHLYDGLQKYSNHKLKIYLTGFDRSFDFPKYLVEDEPEIFLSEFATYQSEQNAIKVGQDSFLLVDDNNELLVNEINPSTVDRVVEKDFKVAIQIDQSSVKKSIVSSLKAIEEVYKLNFEIREEGEVDMLFTDNLQEVKSDRMIFDLSGEWIHGQYPNVYFLQNAHEKRLSAKQQLPTEILRAILDFYGISGNAIKLDQEAIEQKFIVKNPNSPSLQTQKANMQEILWGMLLLVLIAERLVANKAGL